MTIIWCMAPEIWSVRDRIFCHFGPFITPLMTQKVNREKIGKKLMEQAFFQVLFYNQKMVAKNSILIWIKILNLIILNFKFQGKLLLLQTNNVQAMLLQSERVLEMNFPAIWQCKLQKLPLHCQPRQHLIVD